MTQRRQTQPTTPDLAQNIPGIFITRGGLITIDSFIADTSDGNDTYFKWIFLPNGGNVIIENADGNPVYFPAQPVGEYISVVGRRVLSAAVVDGVAVTTNATGQITWYGGA